MEAHAAEYCESFEEILIIFGELEIIELIDELHHPEYFAGRVADGLAENGPVPETGAFVRLLVETLIFVRVRDIDGLHTQEWRIKHENWEKRRRQNIINQISEG